MNIPTAEELFEKYHWTGSFEEGGVVNVVDREDFEKALLDFARLHVTAALEAASQNLEIKLMDSSTIHVIDSSIFNYPLTNIK
jgi:hypothetical protein